MFCYENNLPLTAANTGVYVVNGVMAVMANIIAGKLRQHTHYDFKIIELENTKSTIAILYDSAEIGRVTWDETDAKRANLLGKNNWQEYPKNMYFARALVNAQRFYAPDLFLQPVYIPEELGPVDHEGAPIVEGNYTEVSKPSVTLDDLITRYGPEKILEANDNALPESQEEVDKIAEILGGETDD